MEVRLEGPFGRVVDLVGVGRSNAVYIVEVKSSRSDLKRDDKSEADRKRAVAQLATLQDAAAVQKQIRRNTTHVLRAIAKANTRDLMKACDVRIVKPPPTDRL